MRSFTALRSGSSAYKKRLEDCRSGETATHTVAIPIVSTATLERAEQSCGAMDGALLDYAYCGSVGADGVVTALVQPPELQLAR